MGNIKLNSIKIPSVGMASVHADRMGFPSAHKGGLPGWVKEHLVCQYDVIKQGITNEAMLALPVADRKLHDYSGNGLDMNLFGIDWKPGSGMGRYGMGKPFGSDVNHTYITKVEDIEGGAMFTTSRNQPAMYITLVIPAAQDYTESWILDGGEYGWKVYDNWSPRDANLLADINPHEKKYVQGLGDNPTSNNIYLFNKKEIPEGSFFEAKQLPLDSDALVFDGVKDYGLAHGSKLYLPKANGFTLLVDRLRKSGTAGATTGKRSKTDEDNGAFQIEVNGRSQVIYGGWNNNYPYDGNRLLIVTRDSYNGKALVTKEKDDSKFLALGRRGAEETYADTARANMIFRKYILFDNILSPDQIEYVKTHLMHYVPADPTQQANENSPIPDEQRPI